MYTAQIHAETFVDIFERMENVEHTDHEGTLALIGRHPTLGATTLIQGINGFAVISDLPISILLQNFTQIDATERTNDHH